MQPTPQPPRTPPLGAARKRAGGSPPDAAKRPRDDDDAPQPRWLAKAAKDGRIRVHYPRPSANTLPREFRFLATLWAPRFRAAHGIPARGSMQAVHVVALGQREQNAFLYTLEFGRLYATGAVDRVRASKLQYVVPPWCDSNSRRSVGDFQMRRRDALRDYYAGRCIRGEHRFYHLDRPLDFGKHRGATLRQLRDRDPNYIQWIYEHEDPSGSLRGAQKALLVDDALRNRKVAWRRLKWLWRLYSALWWAAEHGATRRGAHAAPDVAAFVADMGGAAK